MSDKVSARNEILAALEMVLGQFDTNKPEMNGPEALLALHSLAIATREYLQAEAELEAHTAPARGQLRTGPELVSLVIQSADNWADGRQESAVELGQKLGLDLALVTRLLVVGRNLAPDVFLLWRNAEQPLPLVRIERIARLEAGKQAQAYKRLAGKG